MAVRRETEVTLVNKEGVALPDNLEEWADPDLKDLKDNKDHL